MLEKREVISKLIYQDFFFETAVAETNYYFSDGKVMICFVAAFSGDNEKHMIMAEIKERFVGFEDAMYVREFEDVKEMEQIIKDLKNMEEMLENTERKMKFKEELTELYKNDEKPEKILVTPYVYAKIKKKTEEKYGIGSGEYHTFFGYPVEISEDVDDFEIIKARKEENVL